MESEEYETPTLSPLILRKYQDGDRFLVTLSGDRSTKVLYNEKSEPKAEEIFAETKAHYESRKDELDNAQG